jgi:hypothetical protein
MGGPAYFAWSTNYLLDVEKAVVVDVEASTANRTAEVNATKRMVDRTEEAFGMKPQRLIGDSAYGTAETVQWMVEEKNIAPHVTLWDRSERKDGTFSRSDFAFDEQGNDYTCPAGKKLKLFNRAYTTPRTGITKAGQMLYRASRRDCEICPLKSRCCPGQPHRKLSRSVHEAARDEVRRIQNTAEYQQSRKERKKVEMAFAHMKRIMRFDRLRLRGRNGARDEFLLAAVAHNLRKLARYALPSVAAA